MSRRSSKSCRRHTLNPPLSSTWLRCAAFSTGSSSSRSFPKIRRCSSKVPDSAVRWVSRPSWRPIRCGICSTPSRLRVRSRCRRNTAGGYKEVVDLKGLPDRAGIAIMGYTFARVSAVVGLTLGDRLEGKRGRLRLMEKGNKEKLVWLHREAEEFLDTYLEAAGIEDAKAPIFQTLDKAHILSGEVLSRRDMLRAVKQRCNAAGLSEAFCNHTFRGTGITMFLNNTDCSVMRIDKKSMGEVLHREHAFSDLFVAYLLTRNIRYEEDLVDQLFNSSEKRLARILLLLAHFG